MPVRSFGLAGLAGIGAVLSGMAPSQGASLSTLAQHVTSFELGNGMRFAVMERRESPMVALHLVVRAGPLDEPEGQSGISRMFPRLFAHGGDLGTRNPAAEKAALVKVEQALDLWKRLEAQRPAADSYDVSKARVDFQMAAEHAATLSTPKFALEVLENAGAMSIEARADADTTHFSVTLPAQMAEVWFKLMADWLRKPPARRFYAERNSWTEDSSRAAQNSPQAFVEDAILGTAFGKTGYGNRAPGLSIAGELRAAGFEAFARTRYVPGNMAVAIAGDIAPADAKRLAETYFGTIAGAPVPPAAPAVPLEFDDDRIATVKAAAQPPVVVAWPRPPRSDPDDAVFDLIWALLGQGPDSILSSVFESERVPAQASVVPNFPGDRSWSLFAISALPVGPVSREAVEAALFKAASALRDKPADPERLARAKRMLRTRMTAEVESITGVCGLLARFLERGGSAASIGEAVDRIEKVTASDVERVSKKYLRDKGRVILRPGQDAPGGGL